MTLDCYKCGYDLAGLPEHSVCPECAEPIRRSLAFAHRRRMRHAPWPSWLRVLRTIYVTTFLVLLVTPFVLPEVRTLMGLSSGRMLGRTMYAVYACYFGLANTTVGAVVGVLLAKRRSRWTTPLLLSLPIQLFWSLAALSTP